MNIALGETWTVEHFLAWEDRQEGRHEFDGNRVIPMTGGSSNHQIIAFNLMRSLVDRLDLDRFDALPEMRVQIGGAIRYPDVAVCVGPIAGLTRTLDDALVIFAILSRDTAQSDRGQKRQDYIRLPNLRRYVLIEQDRKAATVIERIGDQWLETDVSAGDLALPEVGVSLPLEALYTNVRLT